MLPPLLILLFLRPFISSPAFPIYDTVIIAALLALACASILKSRPWTQASLRPLLLPCVLYCAWLTAMTLSHGITFAGARELAGLIAGPALLFAVKPLSDDEKHQIARMLSIAALVISLVVVYQYFFGFRHMERYLATHPSSDFVRDYVEARRVFFPFITPNALGGYLAMMLPVLLLDKSTRWFLALAVPALLLTRSLGALTAAGCGLLVFYLISEGKTKRKAFYLLAGLTACGAAVFLIRAVGRAHNLPVFSMVMRFDYWEETLKVIAGSPLFGTGPGHFNLLHARYAHNSYLQLIAEAGLPALALFVWPAALALRRAGAVCPKTRALALAAAAVFLAHNLIDFSFFLPEISLLWWVILGLL